MIGTKCAFFTDFQSQGVNSISIHNNKSHTFCQLLLDRHHEVKAIVCVNISQIRITMSKDFFKDQLNKVDLILLIL